MKLLQKTMCLLCIIVTLKKIEAEFRIDYELLKDNNYDVYGVDLDNPTIENIKQFD